jgi:hypothetical protein
MPVNNAGARQRRKRHEKVEAQRGNGLREKLERIWNEPGCRQPDHIQCVQTYGQRLREYSKISSAENDPHLAMLREHVEKYGEDEIFAHRGKKVPPPKRFKVQWA